MKWLLFIFTFISTNAMAEWTPVVASDTFYAYINYSTIRKSGNMVKMWVLYDYKTSQLLGRVKFLSIKAQEEYDCKEEHVRSLANIWASDNMGHGDIINSNIQISNWNPVSPDSIVEGLFRKACDK